MEEAEIWKGKDDGDLSPPSQLFSLYFTFVLAKVMDPFQNGYVMKNTTTTQTKKEIPTEVQTTLSPKAADHMMTKLKISAQAKVWYGDEEHVGFGKGRYKMKGGADFIIEVPFTDAMYHKEKIKAAFNAEFDRRGLSYRYEWVDSELYCEPQEITLDY